MKNLNQIGIFLLLSLIFTACNSSKKEDHSQHENKKEDHSQHDKNKETTFYTCSMDPQVKEDKPGKCPICHMELTPIKQDDSEVNQISLSKQQIQLGNITTQVIGQTQNNLEQNYTGVLTFNQEKSKTFSSKAMGRIEKLYFKSTGDYLSKNQPVFQLYSEDIAIAKQDYYTAFKQLEMPGNFGKNAKNIMNAAKQKLLFYGLSNTQIENIKSNKDVSPYTTFYSTVSGTVSEISTAEGSYIMEGEPIIKVTDLNKLWLETQVNINYFKSLKIGQIATITFVDFPDKSISAKISFINPEINPETRLLLIRFEIPNQNLILKPGMQAIAKLMISGGKGIYIPTDAVIREENASYIWVEKKPGVYENLMVETGIETNGLIEIKTKIANGQKVVITGAYAINSEYKFRKGTDPMEGMKM
ncbi:efflux RND transporter periplasmic adaptor subunit [Flavobacterium channae]|uniref:efflux RND transporter periplasmic adaptor subunit n=1 Tax=Flavobacterium channae TaxID=2897181 RepID=UPI001E3C2722|nr:efflux RND transporter periplasmic adaptor subunit [Flavobacterium channae]UGS24696.1 efflux RND transporter periplasmic adaptor subunit [Flavobacterium channae]